jgi:hypothetical protein
MSWLVSTTLPGAAEKVSAATRDLGGTRWTTAFTVVDRRRGLSCDVLERASRASVIIRSAAMAAFGDTRS